MKRKTDREELLDDVLAEAAPPDFRETLLGESLRAVRRRRRFRGARNAVVIFVLFVLLGSVAWHKRAARPSIATALPLQPEAQKSYAVVGTQPLAASAMVTTHPPGSIPTVDSESTVVIVKTATGNYHDIGDKELLALTANHPAMLVHVGPNSEKLIFANPADAKGFPAN